MDEQRLSPPKTAQTTQPTYAKASFNRKRLNFRTVFPQDCVQAGIPYRSGQGMLLHLTPAKQTIPDLCCSQHHMKLHIYLEYNHTGVLYWLFFRKGMETVSYNIRMDQI